MKKQKDQDASVLFVASMMDNAQQMIRLTKAMQIDPLSETPNGYSIASKLKSWRAQNRVNDLLYERGIK